MKTKDLSKRENKKTTPAIYVENELKNIGF